MPKKETKEVGRNVKVTKEGSILTIVVDLSKRHGLSKSQKNEVIATTGGNVEVVEGVRMGLNIYTPAD